MKLFILSLLICISIKANCQSQGEAAERVNKAVKETEIMAQYFIDQLLSASESKSGTDNEIIYPYAPADSELLSLVDEYHLLMLSLINDFSKDDLTSGNYLKKLQDNSAVKHFQSKLSDQIIILKEGFLKDTEEALEGIGGDK